MKRKRFCVFVEFVFVFALTDGGTLTVAVLGCHRKVGSSDRERGSYLFVFSA
jgi:hypothetical protein